MESLAIIGGGAAGLAAAVRAGELAHQCGMDLCVTVYEADDRIGRPILRTGNGRCNFTNAFIQASDYRNAEFVGAALDEAGASTLADNPVLELFEDWGLAWKEEAEGRRYPATGKATTVLNVLRSAMDHLGVEQRCDCRIMRIDLPREEGGLFTLVAQDGEMHRAHAVIVACGGTVARGLLPDDFAFVGTQSVLGPVDARLIMPGLDGKKAKKHQPNCLLNLNNIRVECTVRALRDGCQLAEEQGELLFRKYGVSGIAVFNLSRFVQAGDVLEVDLLARVASQDVQPWLHARLQRLGASYDRQLTWEDMLRGLVLPPVAQMLCELAHVQERDLFEHRDVMTLERLLKGVRLEVLGVHDSEGQCQVHRGGFAVDGFDPRTCGARDVPGLYVVGEALDVDAPCGGYNLHWAWTSGMLAAQSAVAGFAAF